VISYFRTDQNMTKEALLDFIEISIKQIELHKQISTECEVDEMMLELHNKTTSIFETVKNILTERSLSINYIQQFQNDLSQTLNFFTYRQYQNLSFIQPQNKESIRNGIESQNVPLQKQLEQVNFNLDFFKKLNFFSSNIVAVGANGSGKTTLSNHFKKYLPNTGIVISAQKLLIIPTFSGVSNFNSTSQKLQQSQTVDKSLKVTYSTENQGNSYSILTQVGGEFQVLLDNLLAERSVVRNKYFDLLQNGQVVSDIPVTRLDKALKIWNTLIQHRILECTDGINIILRPLMATTSYPAHQMSDGEKVALYLIAHILQAPEAGFIIIDEPEMYLHKTILKKLWDILELERQDCIFIYLTHDLDFATSRTAKKVWIRSFNHPSNWEIENIPDNELPEPLLLELLGSRKNILFCEGIKGSIDEKIYNILFPDLTITPVDNCFAVINYTKAFNKLPNSTTKAFGIIDADHNGTDRLQALRPENVFSISMTEPENLLLDESFLELLAEQLLFDKAIVQHIKTDIIEQLKRELELQISNYVSAKINYYFKDSHVSKGNTLALVNKNFMKFSNEIKIQEWYDKRKLELDKIIDGKDYVKALSVFNNKGLKAIVNKHFKITDFTERAIKLLQFQSNTHSLLQDYFPTEITNKNGL
ncbi:ABC-type cobalamin/Fe3+-siderophores transport system ATPase subunit, partial [Pedobacter sp. UYP30]|uniref:AAA family ATPase n=1 Tax=Pedobacter sp. UYP30 TaxID=1756400 RepID=UPI0033923C91